MKNYYEILEVDKNASQEVIEKAYKALAKKYHPDLQQGAKRNAYAEKMKIINEAYDILSDNFKREQYNQNLQNEQLQNQAIPREEQERILQENYRLKQQINQMGYQRTYSTYRQNSKSREYKHDLKKYLKIIKVILITICICFVIYQIPPIKHFFQNLYNENMVFQAIVDIFKNTFSTDFK